MKMKRKLISLMIIGSALAGLLPGAAFAEEDTQLIKKHSRMWRILTV